MPGRTTVWAVVCGVGLGVLGCGPSRPNPSDPALGRDTLKGVLDAWKAGGTPDAYQQANPAVTVAERHWKQGTKLLDYEFDGDGKPDGFDVQFKVKLTVQDAAGKKSQDRAVYNVSTTPKLVVVRYEAGS
ncbi:MAG: hypothetical protein U0804_20235 [Gemmataceae bacterium]